MNGNNAKFHVPCIMSYQQCRAYGRREGAVVKYLSCYSNQYMAAVTDLFCPMLAPADLACRWVAGPAW